MTRIFAVIAALAILAPTFASAGDTRLAALISSSKGEKRMTPRPDIKTAQSCLYLRCARPMANAPDCCAGATDCVCSSSECQCR
jgi:hypothetical protein